MLKFEYRDVENLIPYENNPRGHKSVDRLVHSVEDYGFINPIIVDENNVILAGHGRLMAAKQAGLTSVPCVMVDDLDEEHKIGFRIADNSTAEESTWDKDALKLELEKIDFKMDDFGLKFDFESEEEREFGDERLRTDNAYNLYWNDTEATDGWYQMPIIRSEHVIPTDLTGFNYILSSGSRAGGVHFFLDDYQFERIWNYPEKYIDKLSGYECVLSPNFSLYMDMPMAMKIWNTYRSRLVGQILQRNGIHVIPTICWAEEDTFEFVFDGVEENSVVAVSTIGCKDPEAMEIWRAGCDEMIRRLHPEAILLYGGRIDYDFGDIEVYEYKNHVTEGMKNGR